MHTKLIRAWILSAVIGLILTLGLIACGDVDNNSTSVSGTVRPQTIIAAAQQNNQPNQVSLDPTRNPTLVAGATATPIPPQPTAAQAAPAQTTAAANPPTNGGAAAPAQTTAAAADPALADAGAKLFSSVQPSCAGCHPNGGKNKGVGPVLLGTKRDDAYIHNQLKNGKGAMPAYPNLTDEQQNQLIAYIRSIK